MPVTPTYPGVYIEEIPSGVRTITGVATSITAFIGRALTGPVNESIVINSYSDFERTFGGLWLGSSLGFSVRDFYLNGGSQAIVIRLYHPETGKKDKATLSANGLNLEAVSPGSWGNDLRVRIDYQVLAETAERYGLVVDDLFNLTVRNTKTGVTEQFLNVSVVPSARQIDRVLQNESTLIRTTVTLDATRPTAHVAPTSGQDIWAIDTLSSKVLPEAKATDGGLLTVADFTGSDKEEAKQGLYALEQADLFNLLCLPPYREPTEKAPVDVDKDLIAAAAAYCEKRRAMLLIDAPPTWNTKAKAIAGLTVGVGTTSKNAALFFPRLQQTNPLRGGQVETYASCGAIAGIFSRTDQQRGVWKAPAGLDATVNGIVGLSVNLTDPENGELNPLGINCLRSFPASGRVVWGSRTLKGNDQLASEWKYIPVRRTALFLEESLYRGTQWVVFEPNDEPLWAQIRLNLGAFMNNLFRQGAFQGTTPKEAYFVKCDKETTTQNDINLGIVNIVVGYAPLKPAEFVIIKFQQMAGQLTT
jgi:uncharacterized protein